MGENCSCRPIKEGMLGGGVPAPRPRSAEHLFGDVRYGVTINERFYPIELPDKPGVYHIQYSHDPTTGMAFDFRFEREEYHQ